MKSKRERIKTKIQGKRRKTFVRSESWRYKRVDTTWRKPRGIEQKMRVYHNGNKGGIPKSPSVGHRTPTDIRGLHPSGYESVIVECERDLAPLKPKRHAIMIASKVGKRKRIELKDEILARGFKLLNPGIEIEEEFYEDLGGDIDTTLGSIEDQEIELSDVDLDDVDEDIDADEDTIDDEDDEA